MIRGLDSVLRLTNEVTNHGNFFLKMRHDRVSLKDNLFLRMEEGKHFMPTFSTLIIYIPYVIKSSYFLLCHSWHFHYVTHQSNVHILLCIKPTLPGASETPWTCPSLTGFTSFHQGFTIPFSVLPPNQSIPACGFPNYLAKIWQ